MIEAYRASSDVSVLASFHDLPGYGILTINAFVLHAAQPMLIDTATSARSAVLDAPAGEPFVGHDQEALRAMLDRTLR